MPISNTIAKYFENLISYLNNWWNVLSDFLYFHSFTPKNGCKVGQYKGSNRPKNRVFGLLRKIESLVFARHGLKWRVLWLANFQHQFNIWENSYSRDICAKALDQSESSIFQITIYLLNRFTVFYIFLHIDRIL